MHKIGCIAGAAKRMHVTVQPSKKLSGDNSLWLSKASQVSMKLFMN